MCNTVNLKACAKTALIFATLLLSAFSVFVGIKHVWAEHVLDATDFQKRTTSGATFFAGPKRLFLQQHIGLADVTKHLQNIGFTETDNTDIPGTYQRRGKFEVTVTPRLPEFERLRVGIHSQRITSLSVALKGEREFHAVARGVS